MKVEKALVLAAGKSSRFGRQKLLHNVEGTSLLGQVLQTLQSSGIKIVYVVIGHKKDNIIREIGKNYAGLEVNYIIAENWERGNLHSFFSAKEIFKENFVLCMGDHIFDGRIVEKLIDADFDPNSKGIILHLAIDRNSYSDDDTRVSEINGEIIRIGKYLKDYNCTDAGFFLCSPKVFSYAKICVEKGDSELADCIQLVAERGLARVIDISGLLWVDVDTERDIERAYRERR